MVTIRGVHNPVRGGDSTTRETAKKAETRNIYFPDGNYRKITFRKALWEKYDFLLMERASRRTSFEIAAMKRAKRFFSENGKSSVRALVRRYGRSRATFDDYLYFLFAGSICDAYNAAVLVGSCQNNLFLKARRQKGRRVESKTAVRMSQPAFHNPQIDKVIREGFSARGRAKKLGIALVPSEGS
ncbi:hypothetical protein [Aeoliella sp.]|uniref:hypothetical protein n=1 Tax=Aeoliella sp. TaxID=2795800 RepID=UPI003CCC09CE